MKPNEPLIQTLQVWRVRPPSDPRFRSEVWRRIEALRGTGSWAGFARAHAAGLAAAVVLTAGLSGWIGHTAAQVHVRADRDTLLAGYVASLDARIQTGLDEESP